MNIKDLKMSVGFCGWLESDPVLGWYEDKWIIVKLEQIDEDCEPRWYSCCSEHWSMEEPEHIENLPDNPK